MYFYHFKNLKKLFKSSKCYMTGIKKKKKITRFIRGNMYHCCKRRKKENGSKNDPKSNQVE